MNIQKNYKIKRSLLGSLAVLFLFLLLLGVATTPANANAYKNVLLVVAMPEEAEQMRAKLQLKAIAKPDEALPIKAYQGTYKNLKITLLLNGQDPRYKVESIGSEPAVLTTYLAIKHYHADLIISTGVAGGMRDQGVRVGDIYVSDKIMFYDRRLHSPAYQQYGKGNYRFRDATRIAQALQVKTGIVCSGGSFEDSTTDIDMLKTQHCSVKDMEAAGVAWVAELNHIPMFAFKGITDEVIHKSDHDQFEKNYSLINKKMGVKILQLIDYLSKNNY